MKFRKLIAGVCFVISGLSVNSVVHAESLEAAYQEAGYSRVIQLFDKLSVSEQGKAQNIYLVGQAYFKSQDYKNAALKLSKLLTDSAQFAPIDTAYFAAQSYYASSRYEDSDRYFEMSAKSGYQLPASNYYRGYIAGLQDQEVKALGFYRDVLANSAATTEFKQAAWFQVGELYSKKANLTGNKEYQRTLLGEQAKPAYEHVIDRDENTPLAKQAANRLFDIQHFLKDSVPLTEAGHPRPLHAWVIVAGEEFKYDTNLISQSGAKTNKVSYQDSFFNTTSILTKYEWIYKNWAVVTPELYTDHKYHWRRDKPEVFTYDAISISPALRTRLDHKYKDKPASGLLEYEFGFTLKDVNAVHKYVFYTKTGNFIIGERFEPWAWGATSIKLNYKLSENTTESQNYLAPGIQLGQYFNLAPKQLLFATLSFESQKAKSPSFDQRSYKLSASYSRSKLIYKIDLSVGLDFTLTDLMLRKAARGLEKTYAPSLSFSRSWDRQGFFTTSASYAYTRNVSLDKQNFDYSKSVMGLNFQVTF